MTIVNVKDHPLNTFGRGCGLADGAAGGVPAGGGGAYLAVGNGVGHGGALGPDGCIYGFPAHADRVLKVDPAARAQASSPREAGARAGARRRAPPLRTR